VVTTNWYLLVMLELGLKGKVAIVTGGSEGLGRACVERFARFGGVDILVNNAGTSAAGAFETVSEATWQADFDVKLFAAIRLCRLVIPHMKRRGGGRIINVTTVGGKVPAARALPTSVSRAAGINLTKSLANEYAADRILVNTVCLGLVKSGQWERRARDGAYITGTAVNFDGGISAAF
jgi:NAD(P)-dependent dehydrogenase (short-subunit alcohol dehydrogenase family)